jgi:hypothetical protein
MRPRTEDPTETLPFRSPWFHIAMFRFFGGVINCLPIGFELEHQPTRPRGRPSKSFPSVTIASPRILWTHTPQGRCSNVGWTRSFQDLRQTFVSLYSSR